MIFHIGTKYYNSVVVGHKLLLLEDGNMTWEQEHLTEWAPKGWRFPNETILRYIREEQWDWYVNDPIPINMKDIGKV